MFEKIFGKVHFKQMFERRKISRKDLEKEKVRLEKKWRKREPLFFGIVAKKFGPWKRKVYFCHVSSTYICGGGYEYPTIIVFPFSKYIDPLDTIAHELLHLKVIEDCRKFKLKPRNWIEFFEIAVAWMSKEIKNEFTIPISFPNNEIEKKFQLFVKKIKSEQVNWNEFLVLLGKYL